MNSFFSIENMGWLWRAFLIQIITVFFFIISFVHFSFPLDIKPYFILIVIFYWSINRPSIIPPLLIFAIGILQDLISEYPIGLHSILYLLVYFLITRQRLYLLGQTYFILWIFFALTTFGFAFCQWLFFSIRYMTFFEYGTLVGSCMVTIFLYPIINYLLMMLHRMINAVSPLEH